jgi:hypothetical protein
MDLKRPCFFYPGPGWGSALLRAVYNWTLAMNNLKMLWGRYIWFESHRIGNEVKEPSVYKLCRVSEHRLLNYDQKIVHSIDSTIIKHFKTRRSKNF